MQRRELNTVDLFCGAGGASTGMELALSRLKLSHRGLAINHWSVAVDTMRANHPCIDAKQMSIEEAVPGELVPGGEVDLLWASPSCTHHSRAKGGKPRDNQLRAQPELILTWLDQLFVRRMIVENVPEFVEWGPLGKDRRPLKNKAGDCFKAWINSIEKRNYIVEWRVLNCADYGDATTRRRFFLQAVRKGCGRIVWPEPEYAEKPDFFLKPWRGVRECLDLTDTGKSIFNRPRPLARKTLERIFAGLRKYNGLDFIALLRNNETAQGLDEPLKTISTSGAHHMLCQPIVVDHFQNGEAQSVDRPIGAQTTHDRYSVVTPFIMNNNEHNVPRPLDKPLATLTTGNHAYLCTPLVLGQQGGATPRPADEPCPTIATSGAIRVITPLVLGRDACATCRPADKPMPTLTTGGAMRGIFPILEDGRIIDVRIRMLKPSELAAAHSFPADYKLAGNRTAQVKQIGNSVPCRTAAAICEAALRGAA